MRLSQYDRVHFLEQFSAMLSAGLSLPESLNALTQSVSLEQAELAQGMLKALHQGKRLSACFAEFDDAFDQVFINSVYSAEESGSLIATLKKLTEQSVRADKARRALLGSLTYPLVQLLITLLMVAFLLYYMLPRFLPFFSATGQALPHLTQMVLDLSRNWVVRTLPILLFVLAVFAVRAWRVPRLRDRLLDVIYLLPGIGRMFLYQAVADACEQLALQLESGLLFDSSLRSLSKCAPFSRLRAVFARMREGVRSGESIEDLAHRETLLPPIVCICLSVGDEVARLPEMLHLAAEILTDEIEAKKDSFFQLLEPMLLMVMGLSVGIIVLACFLPVYHLATANM